MRETKKPQRATVEAEEADEIEAKDQSELDESVDDLLADIDDVLEENAEDFVAAYVQKGGQ